MSSQPNNVRRQKKNQTARQAMMISGLQTIYRNNANSNAIKKNIQSETRIFFLDISLSDINEKYAKIHQIIENGRLRPKGTEIFFVKKQMEHLLLTDKCIYEIKTQKLKSKLNSTHKQTMHHLAQHDNRSNIDNEYTQFLQPKILVDGDTTTIHVKACIIQESLRKDYTIPVLIDESYFKSPEINNTDQQENIYTHHIPTENIYIKRMKKIVRFHINSPNAFVFIFDEYEKNITDFYMTTENGILQTGDKLNNSFKDDLISFLSHFKLCS